MTTLPTAAATEEVMFEQGALAAMRPNAYIVNIGRGSVIDQNALITALRDKRIAGAGLDVFSGDTSSA